jgi:hypothetical protein
MAGAFADLLVSCAARQFDHHFNGDSIEQMGMGSPETAARLMTLPDALPW